MGRFLPTILLCILAAVTACGRRAGCDGPSLNTSQLSSVREFGLQSAGPRGYLVVPNPIDATENIYASVNDSRVVNSTEDYSLPSLLTPQRLESAFIKTRIRSVNDAASMLATPNGTGEFRFNPSDIHYSETMAYRSLTAIQAYIETLGFQVVQSRPLYVMVQAEAGSTINAFYDHAYLNPASPRTIKLYGATQFAPGVDQDMYWHEFGHLFNESVTGESGMDYAGDLGAVWTEGAALHECLADYLAESVSDKSYIGKWVARNLPGYQPGEPLRSAEDDWGRLDFRAIATADGKGTTPERYQVAEWCSRVLWDIRQSFVDDNPETGSMLSDRMIYSAASLLGRDSSLSEFKRALLSADSELHCGGHESVIQSAFESRGFFEAPTLSRDLEINASSTVARSSVSQVGKVTFLFRIRNSNSVTARNVRVVLEPLDARLKASTYMQAFGDLAPGKTIGVGTSGGMSTDFSVTGTVDAGVASGQRLRYRLRLLSEGGADVLFNAEVAL